MIGSRGGVYLRDERLTVVASSGRRGGVQSFTLEPGELPGPRLKSELESRRIKLRRMRIGLARPLLTVKTLELPPARGARSSTRGGWVSKWSFWLWLSDKVSGKCTRLPSAR